MATKRARDNSDAMRWESHLVEPEWLSVRLDKGLSDLAIVDMRGFVQTKMQGDGTQTAEYVGAREEYLKSHIPGAVYIDWTTDIVNTFDPVPAQAADAAKISSVLGGLGIGDKTQIIAYDSHPSMQFATRLWWICRYFGNENVRVLSGGWSRWLDEGRPTSSEVPDPSPRDFTAKPIPDWLATSHEVLEAIDNQEVSILDARDVDQYTGAVRRGKRGGHIPGAIHLPREAIFDAPGQLKQPAALWEVIKAAGITKNAINGKSHEPRIIAYCNGGVAATSVLFALSILGFTRLTNYDGSWNEWNLDDKLPVETE